MQCIVCSASFVDDETEPAVGRAEDPLRQGCEDCTDKRPKSGGFEKGREITLSLINRLWMEDNFTLCVNTQSYEWNQIDIKNKSDKAIKKHDELLPTLNIWRP